MAAIASDIDRPTAEELLKRAEALVPVLRARASEAEALRRLPAETMADLHESGLFLLAAPKSMGGYGYGFNEFANVTRILAQGCPSTAWVYSFMVLHFVSMILELPEEAQQEVHGGQPFVASANSSGFQANGSGTAVQTEHGWIVNGKFPFSSGVMNSDWIFLTTLEQHKDADPTPLMVIVPVAELEIEDMWYFNGLKATGSNNVVAKDLLVPYHRRAAMPKLGDELKRSPSIARQRHDFDDCPLAGFSALRMFDALLCAVSLGAAEFALEDFRARVNTRILAFGGKRQIEQPEAWARYSEAHVTVEAARLLWDRSVQVVVDLLAAGEPTGSLEQNAGLRIRGVKIGLLCRDAVATMMDGAGSSVHHADNPLGRAQRDINVSKGHSYCHWDDGATQAGYVLLGLRENVHFLVQL